MAENAKWYVVHTYSGYENAVKAAIEKFVANRGLEDMILKIEIPMETVTEVTESGVMKEVERKVFPGYVLLKMVLTDDTWHLIRNIRGVTGFVGSANKAIPLTEEEVAALGVEKHEIVVMYNVGDTVRITDGRGNRAGQKQGPRGGFHVRQRNTRRAGARSGGSAALICGRFRKKRMSEEYHFGASGRDAPHLAKSGDPSGISYYHILLKEVPIHGTESCRLRKTADSRG